MSEDATAMSPNIFFIICYISAFYKKRAKIHNYFNINTFQRNKLQNQAKLTSSQTVQLNYILSQFVLLRRSLDVANDGGKGATSIHEKRRTLP